MACMIKITKHHVKLQLFFLYSQNLISIWQEKKCGLAIRERYFVSNSKVIPSKYV